LDCDTDAAAVLCAFSDWKQPAKVLVRVILQRTTRVQAESANPFRKILVAVLFTLISPVLLAHSPHDAIDGIALSFDGAGTATVYAIVRNNLFSSRDNGITWQRHINGLDYRGRLQSVAASRNIPSAVYVSTEGDGIFRSDDAGASWRRVNNGLQSLNFGAIAILDSFDGKVLAAGIDGGLYLTENAGDSWQSVANRVRITAIAHSVRSGLSLAGGIDGDLLASYDGITWHHLGWPKTSGADITALAISPNFSIDREILVGTGRHGIFRAELRGTQNVTVTRPLHGPRDLSIQSIEYSPGYESDRTAFATTWRNGVYKTTDEGYTWQRLRGGLKTHPQADAYAAPHFRNIVVSSGFIGNQTIYVAGFAGLFKSMDGGSSWQEQSTLSRCGPINVSLSPDFANDSSVAVSTYRDGVFLSVNGGAAWSAINDGLETENVPGRTFMVRSYEVAFSPAYETDSTLFLATGNRLFKKVGRENSWTPVPLKAASSWLLSLRKYANFTKGRGRGPRIAFSPDYSQSGVMFAATPEGDFFRSRNGGGSFAYVGNAGTRIYSLFSLAGDDEPGSFVAGSRNAVYLSTDGGLNWKSISTGLGIGELDRSGGAVKVAISSQFPDDGFMLAATRGGAFRTVDGGSLWQRLPVTKNDEERMADVVAISPDFANDQMLLVNIFGRGLYRSIDGGATFAQVDAERMSQNLSLSPLTAFPPTVMSLVFSPSFVSDRTIFAVSDLEVLKSADSGLSWTSVAPLPCR
jgi:photosystem II stability/assembly factor-like uncharacterized protein